MNRPGRTRVVLQHPSQAKSNGATNQGKRRPVQPALCVAIALGTGAFAAAMLPLYSGGATAADRAELFTRAEQHLVERERLVQSLAAVAKDESVGGLERERALKLLSTFRTEKGRVFMLSNLSMRINHGHAKTDDDQARRWACLYYLTDRGYRDWNTVLSILGMLDKELPKEQIGMFPYVLRTVFNDHPGVAKAILEAELKQEMNEPRKNRLARLREALGR